MNKEIKTNLHPRDYSHDEVFRIINPKQAKLYIKNNVFPIDIYSSIDKNDMDVLVYVFLRSDTKDVYEKWKNYELD